MDESDQCMIQRSTAASLVGTASLDGPEEIYLMYSFGDDSGQ